MAQERLYQGGQAEGGLWRLLALGFTIGIIGLILLDKINISLNQS